MTVDSEHAEVRVFKDDEAQRPIPSAWRPSIREIVHAFVNEDYGLSAVSAGVVPLPADEAERIKDYIRDYGATLVDLPDETWNSSVCIWLGNRWEALIDLWTVAEGCSDLVLNLDIAQADGGFVFRVHMVYVP